MKRIIVLVGLFALVTAGCATNRKNHVDDSRDLKMRVKRFHADMRWARYDSAAKLVAPEERQRFLGRYEELGEDYDIASIELRTVTRPTNGVAVVEIIQESVTEPSMVVDKHRYVELWKKHEGGWMLSKRMRKKEWKAWKKEHRDRLQPEDASDSDQTDEPEAGDQTDARGRDGTARNSAR